MKIKISYAVDPLSVGDEDPKAVAEFIADTWEAETKGYEVEINVTAEPSLGNGTIWADGYDDDYDTLREIKKLLTPPNLLWERFCRQESDA
jgi:hypothetical protein